MDAYMTVDGRIVAPKHPKVPGPAGDETRVVPEDDPEYDRWRSEAVREAVYGAWQRVGTVGEADAALRLVAKFEDAAVTDPHGALAADAAGARALLEDRRRRIGRDART